MKRLASALALAGLVATGTAVAKPGDVYLFGHYTYANLNGADSLLKNAEPYAASTSTEQTPNRLGFGAGYVLDDRLSFELDYKDLGRSKGSYDFKYSRFTGHEDIKASSQTLVFRAVGTLPITRELSLEGSGGLAMTSSKMNVDFSDTAGDNLRYSERRTTVAPTFGVGATYAFSANLAAFGRYEYIHNGVDSRILSHDSYDRDGYGTLHASTFDIGLRYTF